MRVRLYKLLICMLMFATGCIHLNAQQQAQTTGNNVHPLSQAPKAISYSHIDPHLRTAYFFNHGYLIQVAHQNSSPSTPNIQLSNSDGQLEHEISIWPEGAVELFLTSADVSIGKQLVFAGWAKLKDGGTFAFFAISTLDGANPQYFATGEYLITQIAEDDDGSLWALVAEHSEVSSTVPGSQRTLGLRWNNYDMLRHYSSSGVLLEHFLPRWEPSVAYVTTVTNSTGTKTHGVYDSHGVLTTTAYGDVTWGYGKAWQFSRQAFLRSSGSKTVLYDGMRNQLCMRDSGSKTFTCSNVSETQRYRTLTGFALRSNGDVLASMKTSVFSSGSVRGLFLLTSRTAGSELQWVEVPGTENKDMTRNGFLAIIGTDGQSLVYRQVQKRGAKATVLYESAW